MFRYIIFPFAFAALVIYANYTKGGSDDALFAALFMGALICIDLIIAYGRGKFNTNKDDS